MIVILGALFVSPFVAAGLKNFSRGLLRTDPQPLPSAPVAAPPTAVQTVPQASSPAGELGADIAAGAKIGAQVGAAAVAGINAVGGTDSTQKAVVQGGATAIGAVGGAAVGLGAGIGTVLTVAGPVGAALVLSSGAISAVANVNRQADNDKKRAESIASKGAKATWVDDLKTAVSEIKSGMAASESIGYHDVDPQYFRRGYAGTGFANDVISAVDAFSVFVTPTTATASHLGQTRTKTVAGYVDVYPDGTVHPHKMTEAEVQAIIANEIAKGIADDKAAAIAGYGSGSGSLINAVGAFYGTATPTAAQITAQTGIAATGSKTDRVTAAAGMVRTVNLASDL